MRIVRLSTAEVIDKSVPEIYHETIKKGVMAWNEAMPDIRLLDVAGSLLFGTFWDHKCFTLRRLKLIQVAVGFETLIIMETALVSQQSWGFQMISPSVGLGCLGASPIPSPFD